MDVGGGALEIALGARGPSAGPPAQAPAAACAAAPVQHGGRGALSARRALLALAIIVAGGVALRMYGLYGRSMWFDEGFSWRTIQFPVSEMIERIGRDNHPPLYFILLKLWTAAFGESLVALRSMNLAVSALAMAGIYLWAVEAFARDGERARARWIGLVSAALFAVSMYQIRAAWEIRMYAMGTALAALSTWLLLRALFAPVQRWGAWAAYAAAALAFAYTHYFALYSLVGQAVFAVGFLLVRSCGKLGKSLQEGRRDACTTRGRWWRAVAAYTVVAVGWAPWLPTFLRQKEQVASDFWSAPFSLRDVYRVCYEMFFSTELGSPPERDRIIATLACLLVLVCLAVKARAGEWCLLSMTALPFSLACATSLLGANPLVPRYVAFIQPFLLAGTAALLSRIPDRLLRNGLAAMLVVMGLEVHLDFVESLQIDKKPGARAAAAYIDAERREGEPVIASSGLLYFPMLFHARDRNGWFVYAEKPLRHYKGGPVIIAGETVNGRDVDAVRSSRAWVVNSSGRWAWHDVHIPAWWRKVSEKGFAEINPMRRDVVVELYEIGGK